MKLDVYHYHARLKPALLVVLPASLSLAAWFPDDKLALAGLATLLSSFGLCALFAQIGRDMGYAKEPWLFQQWGGKPTTVRLRYQGTSLDWVTHARVHDTLSSAVGIPAPTRDGEVADPKGADEVYEAFTTFLREATRDKEKYRLVYAEMIPSKKTAPVLGGKTAPVGATWPSWRARRARVAPLGTRVKARSYGGPGVVA